jgi:hypothetical protein
MASCPGCTELLAGRTIDKPREYLELAYRLLGLVNAGVFVATQSTCPLPDLFKSEWPADTVEHNFECSVCGRTFQLFADTYNGHAAWDLTGPPRSQPEPELAPEPQIELGSWITDSAPSTN